jgi:hypothetical protein
MCCCWLEDLTHGKSGPLMLRLKPLHTVPISLLRGPLKCQVSRHFALSRFPERSAPSGGRTRPRTPAPPIRPSPREHDPDSQLRSAEAQGVSSFDTNKSPLLEESQRSLASNPEDGLKTLLQNDLLIVTRSVLPDHLYGAES